MVPLDSSETSLRALVPATLLAVVVVLLESSGQYDAYGIFAIFGAFALGIVLAVATVVFPTRDRAATVFVTGASLTLTAVALYVVYGCVFGCMG